jgi:hypothetical protein
MAGLSPAMEKKQGPSLCPLCLCGEYHRFRKSDQADFDTDFDLDGGKSRGRPHDLAQPRLLIRGFISAI